MSDNWHSVGSRGAVWVNIPLLEEAIKQGLNDFGGSFESCGFFSFAGEPAFPTPLDDNFGLRVTYRYRHELYTHSFCLSPGMTAPEVQALVKTELEKKLYQRPDAFQVEEIIQTLLARIDAAAIYIARLESELPEMVVAVVRETLGRRQ